METGHRQQTILVSHAEQPDTVHATTPQQCMMVADGVHLSRPCTTGQDRTTLATWQAAWLHRVDNAVSSGPKVLSNQTPKQLSNCKLLESINRHVVLLKGRFQW
eukprot:scpid89173/ scgid10647/ 